MAMKPMNSMPAAPTNKVARHPSGQVKEFTPKTAQNNKKLAKAQQTIQTLNSSARNSMGMAPPTGSDEYRKAQKIIAKARIQNRQALRQGYSSPGEMKRAQRPAPVASQKVLSGRSAKTSFEDTNAARVAAGKKPLSEQKFARRQEMSGMNARERERFKQSTRPIPVKPSK
jgi:hypothetical protein